MHFPPQAYFGALIVYIQFNVTQNKEIGCIEKRTYYVNKLRQNVVGNRTMTSNCDVTNSAHQIQMTTQMPLNETPNENFLRTPLN